MKNSCKLLTIFLTLSSLSLSAVIFQNNTPDEFCIKIGRNPAAPGAELPKDISVDLLFENTSYFIARNGNRNNLFAVPIPWTRIQAEVFSIVLYYDSNFRLYAHVIGRPGFQDYKQYPIVREYPK